MAAFEPLCEVLPPTRSHECRGIEVVRLPGDALAVEVCQCVKRGRKPQVKAYRVTEFAPGRGFAGRCFRFEKADGSDVYHCRLAPDPRECTCECAGFTYEASRRGDRNARLAGRPDESYDTLGCCHLDAAWAMVANAWISAPVPTPRPVPRLAGVA
jgi:hypothetical protein